MQQLAASGIKQAALMRQVRTPVCPSTAMTLLFCNRNLWHVPCPSARCYSSPTASHSHHVARRHHRKGRSQLPAAQNAASAVSDAAPAPAAPDTSTNSSGADSAPASSSAGEPAAALSKAAARKARLTPPTVLPPPALPPASGGQLAKAFSNAAVLIDKPLGWTSFDVCGKLRNTLKFLEIKKVGHAGTLDPMASGLLVVATGSGTKFIDDFVAMEKEYTGVIRLGEGTATYDAEGEVSERLPWEHITDEDIDKAAQSFVGDIMQVPPMFSAIKMGGQKLYEMAREGTTVERVPRPITIMSFKVWRDKAADGGPSQDVHFRVQCSKGTYVRSLAYDLGRALGTVAHLTALRRESIGELQVTDAWQLADLLEQFQKARQELGLPPPPPKKPKTHWKDGKDGARSKTKQQSDGSVSPAMEIGSEGQ